MNLSDCDWHPAAPGTRVELRATDSPAIGIQESGAPVRPSTRTWGVLVRRDAASQRGYDLPEEVVRELRAAGVHLVNGGELPAEVLNAATERAAQR